MPHSHPHSASLSSSGSASESFCLSSCSDYGSNLPAFPSMQSRKPNLISKADPTIYSFAWSESNSENPSDQSRIMNSSTSTTGVIDPRGTPPLIPAADGAGREDKRWVPPTLPRPICWTALTHPDIFKEYIGAEGLGQQRSSFNTPSVDNVDTRGKTHSKKYSTAGHINAVNTAKMNIVTIAPPTWVEHLLSSQKLPLPFDPNLVSTNKELWLGRSMQQVGDHTFCQSLDTSSERTAMEWLNSVGKLLGDIHHPASSTNSTDQASRNDQSITQPGRIFDDEGCSKPLQGGFLSRKPDIILIGHDTKHNLSPDVSPDSRVTWPLVQALVEVSVQSNHHHSLMKTLLSKAAVIFDSQLHRRYILGLGFCGKGADVMYFFTLIDRVGAVQTKPAHLKGYDALTLARIIFALTFGSEELLGVDTRVTINRSTGHPTEVLIDQQVFTIIQEVHSCPYLFGRGTRVYIVKDTRGHFHIFKDSWILATHESSEIDHIKKISSIANAEGSTDNRSRFLRPRFVAGEDSVNNTSEPRGFVTTRVPARIRRRIVTGPIGDPITSYRSRVECLQALIDIVDRECLILLNHIAIQLLNLS
jgi:hypothetical protein